MWRIRREKCHLERWQASCNQAPPWRYIMATKKAAKRKYSPKAKQKVAKTMHERKTGKLRSGSGKKVTSRKQAIAIGLSEARRSGAHVPKKKGQSRTRAAAKRPKRAKRATAKR